MQTNERQNGSDEDPVGKSYYRDGERWEQEVYRKVALSRDVWRIVAVCLGAGVAVALGVLWELVPLKSTEVVVLEVDKTTGFTQVARPLEEGGPISERDAVTQAFIVRYIRARETYDPPALRDNFELASLLSCCAAAKDLQELYSGSNPRNPVKLWGIQTRVSVYVKSVNFLTDQWKTDPRTPGTAAVRFETTRRGEHGENVTEHWFANVRFRYTAEPLKNEWRYDNPLGFQVIEYRKDQESVAPTVAGGVR